MSQINLVVMELVDNIFINRLWLLCFVFLFSCSETEISGTIISYYENGNIRKLQEYDADGNEQGLYKFYYPNGILKDSAKIQNNKFVGMRYKFFESGRLKYKANYINDNFRNATFFHENGNREEYNAYDINADLSFSLQYDSTNKPQSQHGFLIYHWSDSLNSNSDYLIKLMLATPPNCSTTMLISDWEEDFLHKTRFTEYKVDSTNLIQVKLRSVKNLKAKTMVKYEVFDSINNTYLRDSIQITIEKNNLLFSRKSPE